MMQEFMNKIKALYLELQKEACMNDGHPSKMETYKGCMVGKTSRGEVHDSLNTYVDI